MGIEVISQDSLFKLDDQGRLKCRNCSMKIPHQKDFKKIPIFSIDKDKPTDVKHIIDDLGIQVRFSKNMIEIQETESLDILETRLLVKEISVIHVLGFKYHITFHDKSCQVLSIVPFKLLHTGKTKSEYILKLNMQDEQRGYYFGLYEFGEFEVLGTDEIKILRSHEQFYVDGGWITRDKTIILSIRDHLNRDSKSENYAIAGYKWDPGTSPEKIWEIQPTYSVNALVEIDDNLLLFGYLNGEIGLFSRKEAKILKTEKIFEGKFLYIGLEGKLIFCSSFKGEIACLKLDGTIIWQQNLGDRPIHNIVKRKNQLHIISSKKILYFLDAETGKILQEKIIIVDPPGSLSSTAIYYKDWLIVSGEGCIINISPTGKIFSLDLYGQLIRVVANHPKGFLTGDDDGNIKLWGYLNVELRKRHLKSFIKFV